MKQLEKQNANIKAISIQRLRRNLNEMQEQLNTTETRAKEAERLSKSLSKRLQQSEKR